MTHMSLLNEMMPFFFSWFKNYTVELVHLKTILEYILIVLHRTPLISVSAKNLQPSNMSGMDGHMPTILKHVHVPQRNLSLFGANPLLMPLMRMGVCFNVWITCTHGHIFTMPLQALSPSPTCPIPHPIPHPWSYLCLLVISCCYYPMFLFFVPLHSPSHSFPPCMCRPGSLFLAPTAARGSHPQIHTNFPFLFHTDLRSTTPVPPTTPV